MYKYDKMDIDKISKDMVKSLFYNDDGTRTDIYIDVLNDIKPYLNPSSTIQIGGGIELEFESDTDLTGGNDEGGKLDINPDELFTQIGGNILLQNYLVIRFRLWNHYKKFSSLNKELRKTNVKLTDLFNIVEKLIKTNNGRAKGIYIVLKDYMMLKKSNAVFQYLLDDVKANPIDSNVDKYRKGQVATFLETNNRKIKSYTRSAEYAYATFIKKIENHYWFKLFNINFFNITSLFNKLNDELTLQKNRKTAIIKSYEKIDFEKYISKKGDKLSDKISKLIDNIEIKSNDNDSLINSNQGLFENISLYYKEVNKYFISSTKKLNVARFDNNLTIPLIKIFKALDSIISVVDTIKKNMSNTVEFLGDLFNDTVFIGKYENNIFNKKFGELRTEALKAKDAFENLDNDLKEIKKRYLNSVYPNPDIKVNMAEIRLAFDTIVNASLLPIVATFQPYFIKGQVVINSSTIDAFVRNFGSQRVQVGGDKSLTDLCKIGGALADEYQNNYLLHSYDMYLVPSDFTNRNDYKSGLATIANAKDFTKPRPVHSILRLARRGNNTGLYMYNDDSTVSTNKLKKDIEHTTINGLRLTPGMTMVTKDIDYVRNDIIIYDFIKDLMKKVNEYTNKVSFITLYYKGKYYIYLINYSSGKLYNYNSKFTPKGDLLKFEIIKSEYYTYLPKNIQATDETVYLLPVFIHIKTQKYIDYNRKVSAPYTDNNTPPNAYYDYDYYLPYDSVFNKLLIPYMNFSTADYMKNFKYDSRSKNLNDIINNDTPIYLYALDPTNLVDMRNKIKFALFFLQNLNVTDENGNNGKKIIDAINTKITQIYEHYFTSYQLFFQKYKLLDDVTKTQNIAYPSGYSNSLFNLFSNKIEQIVFENYYNVFTSHHGRVKAIEKINKYISTFKTIYLRVIEDIDSELLNREKITGIDTVNIKAQKFTSIQGEVFNKVNNKVEYMKPYLTSILAINKKVNEGVEQYITEIRANIKKIEDYERDEFKDIKPSILKDVNPNTAYGNYLRNVDSDPYVGLETTNSILETYNVKSTIVSLDPAEVVFDLYQYIKSAKMPDEYLIEKQGKITNVESSQLQFNPAPKFNDYIPFFSNVKNVEGFINGLKATFQSDSNAKYPNHEIINATIKGQYGTFEKGIFRIYNVYKQKISNEDDKKALRPMKDIADAYSEELKLKLEEFKTKINKRKYNA